MSPNPDTLAIVAEAKEHIAPSAAAILDNLVASFPGCEPAELLALVACSAAYYRQRASRGLLREGAE